MNRGFSKQGYIYVHKAIVSVSTVAAYEARHSRLPFVESVYLLFVGLRHIKCHLLRKADDRIGLPVQCMRLSTCGLYQMICVFKKEAVHVARLIAYSS